ncbi:ferrous iron transport protein A [Caproiciproducens galactitolivorans]|nr:ferrous iron transport protein A [Caproiciproducens galactitolivorans]
MIPLNMVRPGTEVSVHSIRGKDETRRFLESLGFVEDAAVTVITELGGNLIVNVKGTRVAISKAMASRVYAV